MIEKRKDKRIKEENRVFIEEPGAPFVNEPVPCLTNALTRDISLSGARIMTDRCYKEGQILNMSLILSKSKQIIRIRAEVRSVYEIEEGLYEIGVMFEHGVPTSVTALLNHLYRKHQPIPNQLIN